MKMPETGTLIYPKALVHPAHCWVQTCLLAEQADKFRVHGCLSLQSAHSLTSHPSSLLLLAYETKAKSPPPHLKQFALSRDAARQQSHMLALGSVLLPSLCCQGRGHRE